MYEYPELNLAREDMKVQSDLYRPTNFWDEASNRIVDEICVNGIECFRSLPKILSFFAPTYGSPGNGYSVQQSSKVTEWFYESYPEASKAQLVLEQLLNGEMAALSDYRVLLASDDPDKLPYLHTFTESNVGQPVEQFEFEGRRFSRSSLNYLLGLSMLKKHLDGDVPHTIMEIGGGFGSLGEILSSSNIDNLHYIDIDIPPISFIAQYFLGEVFGKGSVRTYAQTHELSSIEIDLLPVASALCSWQLENLQGEVDLFVNYISFQEMEPHIVNNYLDHVKRLGARWLLLRNIREGKQVRKDKNSVGVETPILTDDYLKMLPEYELVERNVLPYGYKTVDGFHSEILLLKKMDNYLQ